ncbi:MAG: formyl transferase [Cytophagales bacterium]|nr:formyl transferase [Bernardetiaceae bacterium]MDW8210728.1 formyl transferase [Cytophagales bacterium]
MKVVVISQPLPPLIYGINRLYVEGYLTEAIVERTAEFDALPEKRLPLWKSILRNFQAEGLTGIMAGIGRVAERRRQAHQQRLQALKEQQIRRKYFGTWGDALLPEVPHMVARSVNDPQVYERVCQLKPDVLLIHGTTIVKKPLMQAVPLALNIHTGLSPWYKGMGSVEWALLNGDALNIGVTLHRLSTKIDGGDIVGQRRIVLEPQDTLSSITARLHIAGIEMAIKAFNILKEGKQLHFYPQNEHQALLIRGFLFSDHLHAHIKQLETAGIIQQICRFPSRNYYLPNY